MVDVAKLEIRIQDLVLGKRAQQTGCGTKSTGVRQVTHPS